MTKKEKEILFKATDEAWHGTKMFEKDKDETGQNLYKMYRNEFSALYDLCDKLGVREEYMNYTMQR